MTEKKMFWRTFLKSLDTEPHDIDSVKGSSGLEHQIIALGTENNSNRVVIISGESDPRYATMAQSDIQAAYPSTKVLLGRPIPINLSIAAQLVTTLLGKVSFGKEDVQLLEDESPDMKKRLEEIFEESAQKIIPSIKQIYEHVPLNLVASWKEVIQQLSLIEITKESIDFSKLIAIDPTELDLKLGLCSVPIYLFSEKEIEIFNRGENLDEAKNVLKSKDIIQYFFPPVDNLALALAEKNPLIFLN